MAQQIPQQYNPANYPSIWEALKAPIHPLTMEIFKSTAYFGATIGSVWGVFVSGTSCGLNLTNIHSSLILRACFPTKYHLLVPIGFGAYIVTCSLTLGLVLGHNLIYRSVHVIQTLAYQQRQRVG